MELKDLSTVSYHPIQERIANVVRTRTMNLSADTYFRSLAAFYLAQMASSMRTSVVTPHRGTLPVNLYVCALGESGMGKGYSMGIIESEIVKGFSDKFTKETFPFMAAEAIQDEANRASAYNNTDLDMEITALEGELASCGPVPYTFDSGTGPAYKQIRTATQIAKCGALNLICDEIGSNLLENAELFKVNLEAFDMGKMRPKVIKHSSENKRGKDRSDPVPANMLVFGTPSSLFNGGLEERTFLAWLEAGYGRRFLMSWGTKSEALNRSAEELMEILMSTDTDKESASLYSLFEMLADPVNYGIQIQMPKPIALINLQYQMNCEAEADKLGNFNPIRKAEMQHRYFKAAKIAGAYAFVDQTPEITEDQMYAAIKLVETCGEACKKILTQDKNYVRLAKYIAEVNKEVTYADLTEDLPFFSGSKSVKEDMVSLSRAWGSRNNIVIKKYFEDGFDILKGETLKETDLTKIIYSASAHQAYHYDSSEELGVTRWEDLHKLVQSEGNHWCNHNFIKDPRLGGHRNEENAQGPFNLVVLDYDSDGALPLNLKDVQSLLDGYTGLYYTTKRHTSEVNRFRIILPLKYELKLSAAEYKEFMQNIFEWLPFDVDTGTDQRCKKWLTHKGSYTYTEGELLDPTQFIPKTAPNDRRIAQSQDLGDLGKIESWFARSIGEGNRNNTLSKFAFMLLDSGLSPDEVEIRVRQFNDKLKNGLSSEELTTTIIKSLWGKAHATNRI